MVGGSDETVNALEMVGDSQLKPGPVVVLASAPATIHDRIANGLAGPGAQCRWNRILDLVVLRVLGVIACVHLPNASGAVEGGDVPTSDPGPLFLAVERLELLGRLRGLLRLRWRVRVCGGGAWWWQCGRGCGWLRLRRSRVTRYLGMRPTAPGCAAS